MAAANLNLSNPRYTGLGVPVVWEPDGGRESSCDVCDAVDRRAPCRTGLHDPNVKSNAQ